MKPILEPEVAEALSKASGVHDTMSTEGWKTIRNVLEDRIASLSDITDITTVKELHSRQSAVRCLRQFLRDLDGISQGYVAKIAEMSVTPEDAESGLFKLSED